jgi:hypothetical protein
VDYGAKGALWRSGAAVVVWSRLQRGLWWPAVCDGFGGVPGAGCPIPCRRLRRVVPSIVQEVVGGLVLRHRGLRQGGRRRGDAGSLRGGGPRSPPFLD